MGHKLLRVILGTLVHRSRDTAHGQ